MNAKLVSTGTALVASLFLLTGCFSNDDSDDDKDPGQDKTLIGVFLDSPVVNINYETKSPAGVITSEPDAVTDVEGKFEYQEGDTVTFSIGALTFPEVVASGTVTPLDIAQTTSPTDPEAANMLRLLQTLDDDGDPSNGITITETTKDVATPVDFDLPIAEFASSDAVQDLIEESDIPATELVSVADAVEHFEDTLEDEGVTVNPLAGSWRYVYASGDEQAVIFHFMPDGRYLAMQWQEANGSEGFEYGTYSYADGDITFVTIENNDGDALTCNEEKGDLCNGSDGGAAPGVWGYSFSDEGQLVFTVDGGSFGFAKLTASSSPVSGLWEARGEKEFAYLIEGNESGSGSFFYVNYESYDSDYDTKFSLGSYELVVNDGKPEINLNDEQEYDAFGLICSSDCDVDTLGYSVVNQQLSILNGEDMARGYFDQVFGDGSAPADTAKLIAQKDYDADIFANDNYGVELDDDFSTRLTTTEVDTESSSSFKATFNIDEAATSLTQPESDNSAGLETRMYAYYEDPESDMVMEVSVRLRNYGDSVMARSVMATCLDESCDEEAYLSDTVSISGDFTGDHTMGISLNDAQTMFVFSIDDAQVASMAISDFTEHEGVVAAGGYTFDPSNFVAARFRVDALNVDNSGESALITVHLDEFAIDGEVFDDFTGGRIDSQKWNYDARDR